MSYPFVVNDGKGFAVTLPNGLTISTQMGWGNYCDNYDNPEIEVGRRGPYLEYSSPAHVESCTAEIAVWHKGSGRENCWITTRVMTELGPDLMGDRGPQEVLPYATMEIWLAVIQWCAQWTLEEVRAWTAKAVAADTEEVDDEKA